MTTDSRFLIWVLSSLMALSIIMTAFCLPQQALAQPKPGLALELAPSSYSITARAGQSTQFSVDIRNYGDTSIAGIRLSSEPPEGWTVVLEPQNVANLASGSVLRIDVSVLPPSAVPNGRYTIGLTATENELTVMQWVDVLVKPASYWLWVGVAVAGIVVLAFVFIFVRIGRQRT